MVLLSAIGDIDRFPSTKQLVGYAGLGACVHDSGQSHRTGGITKQGRGDLRGVLVETAWVAVRTHPEIAKSGCARLGGLDSMVVRRDDDAALPALPQHPPQASRAPGADQRFRCLACRRTFTERTGTAFAGYRFPAEVILMAVRWYTLYRLSAANTRDLLAERGIDVSDRTVLC